MDHGLSLIERDVADHRGDFNPTIDRDLLEHFALGIVPSQSRAAKPAYGREMRARHAILLRKDQQARKGLVSLAEDHRIFLRLFATTKQLNLHGGSSGLRHSLRRGY